MTSSSTTPTPKRSFAERLLIKLLLLALIITFLYLGQSILVPLIAALLFSFLLLPLAQRMEDRGWSRFWAALITILAALLLVIALLAFIGTQAINFTDQMPGLQQKLEQRWNDVQQWIASTFGVTADKQVLWLREQLEGLQRNTTGTVMGIFSTTGAALILIALIPLYVFFLLFYRDKFRRFGHMTVPADQHAQLEEISDRVSRVTARYLLGLVVDIGILSVLFSIGYLLLGLPSAILLAVMAAVLNVIPYIGAFIGGLLPVVMALVTKDSIWYAIGAFAISSGVQFIDNNLIMPLVVGRSVNLNPFATIIFLLLGGAIWGLAGMILFIPLAGMLKIVCDNIPSLKPWGYLMGQVDTEDVDGTSTTRSGPQKAE